MEENVFIVLFLLERIEATVFDMLLVPKDLGFQDVASVAVLFEEGLIKDLEVVDGLIVESNQLNATRPERDG